MGVQNGGNNPAIRLEVFCWITFLWCNTLYFVGPTNQFYELMLLPRAVSIRRTFQWYFSLIISNMAGPCQSWSGFYRAQETLQKRTKKIRNRKMCPANQAHNERATALLDYLGYKCSLLCGTPNEDVHRCKKPVTIAHTKERQDAMIAPMPSHTASCSMPLETSTSPPATCSRALRSTRRRGGLYWDQKDKQERLEFDKIRIAALNVLKQ